LPEAVELCVKAAKGELTSEHATEAPPAPPAGDKAKRGEPKRIPQSAVA
jgi:hypothetical protein